MTGAYFKRRTACKKLRKQIYRSSRLRRKHLIARDTVFELNDENKEKLLNNVSPSIISARYMLRSNINPNQPLNPAYLNSNSLRQQRLE